MSDSNIHTTRTEAVTTVKTRNAPALISSSDCCCLLFVRLARLVELMPPARPCGRQCARACFSLT